MARGNLPHLVTCNNLFCNYDMKKLTGKGNIKRTHKCADKNALAKQIFLRYLYLMFEDLVQGGKTIMLPSKKYFEIRMRRIPPAQFIKARQLGALSEVDILATGGCAYEPILVFRSYGRLINKPIRLSGYFKEIMLERMNSGYKYC